MDAGYRGRGKEWAERALGLSVEVVHRSPKPTPEKVLFAWAREWHKEGRSVDLDQLLLRRGFEVLPRRRSCREAGSRGKDLRLDLPQQEDEHEGLREAVRDRRSVCLRGYGAFDGQAVGP